MPRHSARSGAALLLATLLPACDRADSPAPSQATTPAPTTQPNPFAAMDRPWGTLPAGRDWGQVGSVAIDLDGRHLWAAERCGGSNCIGSDRPVVLKLDPSGELVESFGAGMFIRPHGIHVDAEGNVWVTDHLSARPEQVAEHPSAAGIGHQVFKFSPTGTLLLTLGTAGEAGDPPTHLNNPTDVIVAPDGDIFVSEGHSNENPPGRISKFSADGEFLMSWGSFGEGPGQFRTPHGLAFDSRGRLFVADRGNNRIQVFDQEGTLLEELRQFGRPNDVLIGPGDTVYVIDSESSEEANPGHARGIHIGSAATGEVTGHIPPHPSDRGPEGTHGEGVALDTDGNLYVAEVSIRGLTRYSPR